MKKFPLIYKNQSILYLKNKNIQEFDIINGGYSISVNNNILNDSEVELLKSKTKHEKHVYLGNKIKEDKTFTERLHNGFIESISKFIDINNIKEENILSIKKDSITFFDTNIKTLLINTNIKFSCRLKASSYITLNNKEFFYYNKENKLIVKGLSDEVVEKSELVNEIKDILKLSEYKDSLYIFKHLKELRYEYLRRNLNHSYYKELSSQNAYKLSLRFNDNNIYTESLSDDEIDSLDINYNYCNYILPLIKILL